MNPSGSVTACRLIGIFFAFLLRYPDLTRQFHRLAIKHNCLSFDMGSAGSGMTTAEIDEVRTRRYNSTVTHVEKIHSDLMVIRVKPDFPRTKYSAGQYCTLGLANFEPRADGCQLEDIKPESMSQLVRRSYSISSSIYLDSEDQIRDPNQDDWLEFYIVLVRENLDGRVPALTPRLFQLNVGDRVAMGEKITGHYTLEGIQPTDTMIFLSTGTGEAPHNSMVAELLRTQHQGRIIAACCVRYAKDLGYWETHQRLMKQYPNYQYLPLTTREASVGKKQYIQDLILSDEFKTVLGQELQPDGTHVYLCGNPKMIGIPAKDKVTGEWKYPEELGVIELLEKRGFRADNPQLKVSGNIHFEKYW